MLAEAADVIELSGGGDEGILVLRHGFSNGESRAGLNKEWHLHRFRGTAATRWLRAGIDVRTVQEWLGHESLATTQKYLEPSKETERQLEAMRLPF